MSGDLEIGFERSSRFNINIECMKWMESGGGGRTYCIGVRPHSHHPVNGNGINGEVGRHCYELR